MQEDISVVSAASERHVCPEVDLATTYIPFGYTKLRQLSFHSEVYLCREDASGRLVVLKVFLKEEKNRFFTEVLNISNLFKFNLSPRLLFAFQHIHHPVAPYLLCLEYIAGKSLLDWKGGLGRQEAILLRKAIQNGIETLHCQFGYTHGDLSPRNILAHLKRSTDSNSATQISGNFLIWEITFLDWEFAEKMRGQNLKTYEHFRGTVGYSAFLKEDTLLEDPRAKDWKAFEACMHFLEIEPLQESNMKKKWWSKWI